MLIGMNNESSYEFYEMDQIEEFCSMVLEKDYKEIKELYK